MTFKEAFEHYKAGAATPEEIAWVEEELEKSQLIFRYFENDFELDQGLEPDRERNPGLEADHGMNQDLEEDPSEMLKKIRRSIRKRNRSVVAASVLIIAALVLLIHYAAVPLLNHLFYNPMAATADEFAYDIDFSLIAYTELHQAGIYYANTEGKNTGIGKYDLTLARYNLITGKPDYMAATIDKNNLKIPSSFTADNLPLNAFEGASSPVFTLYPESRENGINALKQLPVYIDVTAEVTFSEDLTMGQLVDMMHGSDLYFMWACIRNAPGGDRRYPLCGMDLTGAGPVYEKINEKYPDFELYSISERALGASDYERHFISLLQYTIDHPYLSRALKVDSDYGTYYPSVLDYVKNNGVKTYGVMVKGSPKDILALTDSGVVFQIQPIDAKIRL